MDIGGSHEPDWNFITDTTAKVRRKKWVECLACQARATVPNTLPYKCHLTMK